MTLRAMPLKPMSEDHEPFTPALSSPVNWSRITIAARILKAPLNSPKVQANKADRQAIMAEK